MVQSIRRVPIVVGVAALLICCVLSPPADASQLVGTGVQRVFALSNDNLDIDGKDDQRVDVDVAIMDFGIDLDHPDLNVVGGVDCVDADSAAECEENTPDLSGDEGDPGDNGHGTRLAGTTGALDNGFGVVGVAPGARLWAMATRDPEFSEESGTKFDLDAAIAGIEWVMQHNEEHPDEDIEVVGLGLVCPLIEAAPPSPPICIGDAGPEELEEVLEEAISMGIVFVTGPGNSNIDAGEFFPQNFPDMIVPSFMNDFDGLPGGKKAPPFCNGVSYPEYTPMVYDDTKSSNSNWGEVIDLTVPGFCIASTETGGGYNLGGAGSAGSAAAPHVIGAAAVLASMHDPQDAEDVEELGETLYGDSDCAVNAPDEGPDVGTGNCGWTDTSEDGVQEPLLDVGDEEVFNPEMVPGEAWTIEPVPNAGAANNNRLTDVSCTSASFCFATGNLLSSGISWGYGRVWDGSTWASVGGVPENSGTEASGVSCTSSTSCSVVGHKTEAGGAVVNYAARWSGGTSWVREELQDATGATDSRLRGVSCAPDCVAVGSYTDSSGVWNLAEHAPDAG
jgi:Subtilase family